MKETLWSRLKMSDQIGKITYNIDHAWYVEVSDEETAKELSEWSKNNHYPCFVDCKPGFYVWDNDDETFYRRKA